MHNFTSEDLLSFIYNETSPSSTAAIQAALENDWSLREELETIRSTQQRLETITFSPSQRSLDAIMNHAEKSISELSQHA